MVEDERIERPMPIGATRSMQAVCTADLGRALLAAATGMTADPMKAPKVVGTGRVAEPKTMPLVSVQKRVSS